METGGYRQPHHHLLAHVFQMTGFTWEYLGSREDFGYRDAQKTPRSPDTPEHGHHRTLVPHGTHRDLPCPAMRQNRVAAAPGLPLFMGIRSGLTVPDRVRPGPPRAGDRTSEPDGRLDREPPRRPVFAFGLGTGIPPIHRGARIHHGNGDTSRFSRLMFGYSGPVDSCADRQAHGCDLRAHRHLRGPGCPSCEGSAAPSAIGQPGQGGEDWCRES